MKFKILLPLIVACVLIAAEQAVCETRDFLLFPKDGFTVETITVKTSAGEKKVKYHSYMHIPYVNNPINRDYQSLNVSVPVEIDGITVDASNGPILFDIGVGGYMSVNNAKGGMMGIGTGGPPPGPPPAGGPGPEPPGTPKGMPPIMGEGPGSNSNISRKTDLALAAGYVVVSPGCRGRDNQAVDGTYYGKAPAAIVDLKAAVRYIRHNRGVMPGNTDWIISSGCSAGGALSALLGVSGNSPLYTGYLEEIGAAEENDDIYASACYSPITDLEHSDMSYEWMYGTISAISGPVDQKLSAQLKASYADYQKSLNLRGKDDFGTLKADNYDVYLLKYYLIPSANEYLNRLSDKEFKEYLENNKWITWDSDGARFNFSDYVKHVGRMKGLPAFDDFNMTAAEPILFGNRTINARHFTNFSLRQTSGDPNAEIDNELEMSVKMMNAMYFAGHHNSISANYWWLRNGTRDNHTSQTVIINLATILANQDKKVNAWLFWDGGHCADDDPEGLISWISDITGYSN